MEMFMETERAILLFIQEAIRNPLLTPFFTAVTWLGNHGMVWIVITAVLLSLKKTRKVGCMMLLSLLYVLVVNNMLLKNLVSRIRPYEVFEELVPLIAKPSDASFPSGHAACAFASAGILYRNLPKRFAIPAVILAFLIAFSRLYLGVHYFSDVLCGMLIGIALSYAAEAVVRHVICGRKVQK